MRGGRKPATPLLSAAERSDPSETRAGRGARAQADSKSEARPWPPPMHMVTIP
jgi:hypothetical protein